MWLSHCVLRTVCGFSLSLSAEAHLPGPPEMNPRLELVGTHETIPGLPDSPDAFRLSVCKEGCFVQGAILPLHRGCGFIVRCLCVYKHTFSVCYTSVCWGCCAGAGALGRERARIPAALAAGVRVRVQAGRFSRGFPAGDGCLPVSSLCLFLRPSFLCYEDVSHIELESTPTASLSLSPPCKGPRPGEGAQEAREPGLRWISQGAAQLPGVHCDKNPVLTFILLRIFRQCECKQRQRL